MAKNINPQSFSWRRLYYATTKYSFLANWLVWTGCRLRINRHRKKPFLELFFFWLKIEKWTYYSKDSNVFVHFLFLSSPHSLQLFSLLHLVWSQYLNVYLYYAIVHLFLRANILLKLTSNAEVVYYDLVEFLNKRKTKAY